MSKLMKILSLLLVLGLSAACSTKGDLGDVTLPSFASGEAAGTGK